MSLEARILQSLRPRKDGVLLRSDVKKFGSASQISVVLKRLCVKGLLSRLESGIYAKPDVLRRRGRLALIEAANARMRRKRKVGSASKRILVRMSVAQRVERLAKRKGVGFVPLFADHWAEAVTTMAGDQVKSDATDDLLVALRRKKAISPRQMVQLLINHHREAKGV